MVYSLWFAASGLPQCLPEALEPLDRVDLGDTLLLAPADLAGIGPALASAVRPAKACTVKEHAVFLVETDGTARQLSTTAKSQWAFVGMLKTLSWEQVVGVGIFTTEEMLVAPVANLVARELLTCWSQQHGGRALESSTGRATHGAVMPSVVFAAGLHFGRFHSESGVRQFRLNCDDMSDSAEVAPVWKGSASSRLAGVLEAPPALTFQEHFAAACTHYLTVLGKPTLSVYGRAGS
eukprot:scaffold1446_cov391-Prasinococcus_capsulatus_cf.AAC.13